MLFGTATVAALTADAPQVEIDQTLAFNAGKVEWAQFTYELAGDRLNLDILPPGLHPTTPLVATLQLWRGRDGDAGDFGLAQLRISCRAGMRIRAYLVQSVIDGGPSADVLSKRFGYGPQRGKVLIRSRSDRIEGAVEVDGRTLFDAAMLEPTAVELNAIQHIANMNPARTADGLTMLQVDPQFTQASLRRGTQRLNAMDNAFWRLKTRAMKYPIVGVAGEALVQIPPVTYTTDPFPKATDAA